MLDHIVYGLSRFDHHKHLARLFQIVNQFFETVAADDVFPGGSAVYEFIHLSVVRLNTATVKPFDSMFMTRFSPMTARPMRPISAFSSLHPRIPFVNVPNLLLISRFGVVVKA